MQRKYAPEALQLKTPFNIGRRRISFLWGRINSLNKDANYRNDVWIVIYSSL